MSSKILFLHPNFPAQFKNIIMHLSKHGHEIIFICQTNYSKGVDNVKVLTLQGELGEKSLNSLGLDVVQKSFKIANQYLTSFRELDKRKWKPDIIVSHSGWGCGAYAKQHWPTSHVVSYLEWWFNPDSSVYNYDPKNVRLGLNKRSAEKHWLRNSLITLEIASADAVISPTRWQKSQLPKSLARKCQVVFDGIDENIYNDNEESQEIGINTTRILTYGTRGMEPMRCFPEFIHCLPKIIELYPNIRVEIAGEDEIHYGGFTPKEGSWKKWALNYLRGNNCQDNIYWMGRLTEKDYIAWLQNSSCHVYLTHPYVASWSLIESILCCNRIVASNVQPVQEFYTENKMLLVDHRSQASLINGILKQLRSSEITKSPQCLVDRVKIDTCMAGWESILDLDVGIKRGND